MVVEVEVEVEVEMKAAVEVEVKIEVAQGSEYTSPLRTMLLRDPTVKKEKKPVLVLPGGRNNRGPSWTDTHTYTHTHSEPRFVGDNSESGLLLDGDSL